MNVKHYRAATMREALEKVKGELGDDALVLSSKSVRDGGFLGMGAKNLIEVTVSTDFPVGAKPAVSDETAPAPHRSNFTSLSLNDPVNTKRTPMKERERNFDSAASTLASRAYSAEANSLTAGASEIAGSTAIVLERAKAREAEARDSTRKVFSQPTAPAPGKLEMTSVVTAKRDPVIVELDRLRAEIREVKFAIGTFAGHSRESADTHETLNASGADAQIYDSPFYETYLHLTTLGLEPEAAKAATRAAIAAGSESKDIQELAHIGLLKSLPSLVKFGEDPLARAPNSASRHPVLALVGPTGVGKTTTIAKLAARTALREGRRVELITLDTYRIAAVEQLKTYAEIIGAGFHVPRSVLELDVLIKRFAGEATVLIDTIGRSARDLADQMELADYLRGNEETIKCLVLQATTHPADAQIAISKFGLFGVSSLVLTKLDETCRPAAAISIAASSGLALVYLCNGQRVPEDILNTTPESLTTITLRAPALAMSARSARAA